MDKIRLLLVDDHEVIRQGLRMLLESQPDLEIAAETDSGEKAISMVSQHKPDVVVMDISLPDMSGIQATRRIKELFPAVSVVALTIHEDEQYFFEMLQAGASGYVPKKAASEDLINAIHSAHQGEIYLYPSLAKALVKDFLARSQDEQMDSLNGLTPRESEVLELLAEGFTNQEIADRLVISTHTVARHRENIMAKLNLHSRSELVKYAIRKGIIPP